MLQNLLPKEQKKELTKEYYVRLVTVVSVLLAGAVGIGYIALLPVYMHTIGELDISEAAYELHQKNVQDARVLTEEVAESTAMLSFLEEKYEQVKMTTLLDEVFAARFEGVSVTGFSYRRKDSVFVLQGIAETRDLVVPYARTLESNERFVKVPVPFSNLAKNTDLEFTLSIELAESIKK